ncbi:NUDIX hydrolase [Actinotalea soli]|uniref:NUDIX hydrolase n=1 Tax=Actinotalea soli TaxID=2819234 RepID=UPI003558DB0D
MSAGPPHGGEAGPGRPPRGQLEDLVARGVDWGPWARQALRTQQDARPAAVLILLGALDGRPAHHPSPAVPQDLDVLLLGRSPALTHHPGQVSFPGGRLDPGDDGPVAAALREAVEETGLDRTGVDVLGTLAPVPVPVSRHLVTPVLAWWAAPSPVGVVDHAESSVVFRAPVADLIDPGRRRSATTYRGRPVGRTPAFLVDSLDGGAPHVVWGFTALLLDRVLDALGWAEPWDPSRTIEVP